MRLLIVASLLLGVPRLADAQFPAEVQPGTRVRVWIPETVRQEQAPEHRQLLRGTVESVDGSTLRLRVPGTAGSLAIPRAAGTAIGGAISFALLNDPKRSGGPHNRTDWRAAGVGAAWGAVGGGFVGLVWPYERWRRVIRR